MLDQRDMAYFAARAAEELELSEVTDDPIAKLVHANLSKRYEGIVRRNSPARPILHMVAR
jgi:hypothetical protein